MDINALINEEVENRVNAKLKEMESEIKTQVENRIEAIKANMTTTSNTELCDHFIKMIDNSENICISAFDQLYKDLNECQNKIMDNFTIMKNEIEQIKEKNTSKLNLDKCNFPECKNFGDGTKDEYCEECDNYKVKQDTIQKEAKEHSDIKQHMDKKEEEKSPIIDFWVNGKKVDKNTYDKAMENFGDMFNKSNSNNDFWNKTLDKFFKF